MSEENSLKRIYKKYDTSNSGVVKFNELQCN